MLDNQLFTIENPTTYLFHVPYKYSSAGFYETGDKDLIDVVHYGAYF